MKLYQIADEIEIILAREVDHDTGEITEETLTKLGDLEMARDEKALAVAAYLKGELAEGDAVMLEAEKLVERAKGHKRRAQRLVEYLQQHIPAGAQPISDSRSRIAWKKNPPKVVIPDRDAVPPSYRRTIPETWEPDKKRIKDQLKTGAVLPFAVLTHSHRLEVK